MLFLCHHAIELYFKASIVSAAQEPPNIHDLIELDAQYSKLYPQYPIEIPPIIKGLTYLENGLFPDTTKGLKGKLHERLRYVTRRDGQYWPGQPQLDPKQFNDELVELRRKMMPVLNQLLRSEAADTL